MPDISKNHLDNLISQLTAAGEDKFELELWSRIFDTLSEEEKSELIANLEQEFATLNSKAQA